MPKQEKWDHQNEASSSNSNFQEEPVNHHLHNEHSYHQEEMVDYDRVHDMVADAFVAHDEDEEPNIDAKKFYGMLNAANQPLYSGCREGLVSPFIPLVLPFGEFISL